MVGNRHAAFLGLVAVPRALLDPVDQVGVFEQHSIAVHVEVDLAGFPEGGQVAERSLPVIPAASLFGDELLVSS